MPIWGISGPGRSGSDRPRFRPDHGAVVLDDCGARLVGAGAPSFGAAGARSPLRLRLPVLRRGGGVSGAGRRVLVRDRGRGPLCRYGAFRGRADPAQIGRAFGPIMALWFLTIAVLGLWGLARHPSVLLALDPRYGFAYLFSGGAAGFLVLGAVFLCVTGAEALYADMGHFGAGPIRLRSAALSARSWRCGS